MAVDLQGFAELQNDLTAMALSLENGSGVNRALEAGAVPIEQQMKANASSDPKIITGTIYISIHTYKVGHRRGGKQISIGVKHSEAGGYYANPLEHGHGGPGPAPPHPFVRPAFDARAEEAYSEIRRVLADEIMKRS